MNIEETKKAIDGYGGKYLISNIGSVCSIGYNNTSEIKDLKPWPTGNGYYMVSLSKDNERKVFLVHRLVAIAFIENPANKPCINHIDGNKANNSASNLEWVTHSENSLHAYKIGLSGPSEKQKLAAAKNSIESGHKRRKIDQIGRDYIKKAYKSHCSNFGAIPLSKIYNVHPATILNVVKQENIL